MADFFNFEVLYTASDVLYKNILFLSYFFDIGDFYFLENLLKNCELTYIDNCLTAELGDENLKFIYLFEHFNKWIKIYLKRTDFLYLYPLQPTNYQLVNNNTFLFHIIFPDYFFEKEKISSLVNSFCYSTIKTSDFKIFNTNIFAKNEMLLLNNNFFIHFFFLYNDFDFEVLLHSIFSVWYPYGSVGVEDFILNTQTSVYTELLLCEDYPYFLKNLFIEETSYIDDYFFINYNETNDFYTFWFNTLYLNENSSFYSYERVYNPVGKSLTQTEFQEQANNYFQSLK